MTSPPVYRLHSFGPVSPGPSTPTSPFAGRGQSSVTLSPFAPSFGGMYMDPELLVNKSVSELPEGVDPCQREVGSASKMSGVYYMYFFFLR